MLNEDLRFCPHCNNEDVNWQEPDIVIRDPGRVFEPGIYERLLELNQHIEDNPAPEQSPPRHRYNESPSSGLFIFMVLLSIFFSIAGLIAGIVYITKNSKDYQFMGMVMLVISVIFIVFGTILIFSVLTAAALM